MDLFREFGLTFDFSFRNFGPTDHKKRILVAVDHVLQNDKKAMLVDVKKEFSTEDVKEHVKRLQKMRAYADSRGDKHSFMGAVGGEIMTADTRNYALDQGFFVIEPSGETLNITPPHGKPKEW